MKSSMLTLFFCLHSVVLCEEERFIEANEYYSIEEYSEAIKVYEDILKNGEHANVYYNLGNSYFRVGDIGNSIWAYEKALKLSPRDSDINFNLKYLRFMVKDKILPPDDIYFISLYKSLVLKFSFTDILFLLGFIFMFLSIKYLINQYFNFLIYFNGFINYTSIVFLLIFSWMALDKYWDISDINHGIITSSVVDVRSSPLDRGDNVVFRIHEGTKVEIQNIQSGWSEIMLLDGKKGWIFSKGVRQI